MPLRSDLFKDDDKLKAILISPSAHLIVKTPRIRGAHIGKVHQALGLLQPSASVHQRDVVTHEICHLFGAEFTDYSVNNTTEGLTNPNTIAQIVSRLNDRYRQLNADGHQPDVPPLPAP